MQKGKITGLLLLFAQTIFAQKIYQLAPPLAKVASVFFYKKTSLSFAFNQPGSSIHYTTDGTEPTLASPRYQKPISVSTHKVMVKAKSFADGFLSSEMVQVPFFSQGHAISKLHISATNPQYAGNGETGLKDNKSGGANHSNGTWMGFDSDSVVIDLSLKKRARISQVLLHVLNSQGAWIFVPAAVDCYTIKNNKPTLIKSQTFETVKETEAKAEALFIDLQAIPIKNLRIVVFPLGAMPEWHVGKGKKAWLFLDEIKLY